MIYLGMTNLQVEVLYDFLVQMVDDEGFEMENEEDQEALDAIITSLARYLNYMESPISEEEERELKEKFGGAK